MMAKKIKFLYDICQTNYSHLMLQDNGNNTFEVIKEEMSQMYKTQVKIVEKKLEKLFEHKLVKELS